MVKKDHISSQGS